MTERKLQRNRRGFTLTEVLLALAILIILLALVIILLTRKPAVQERQENSGTIWRLRTASLSCRPAAAATSTERTGPRP